MIRSPTIAGQPADGALELLEQARLAPLAALLVLEREVVQPAGGGLVVVGVERLVLAGGPRVGGGGVRVLAERDVSSGEMPAASIRSSSAVGSACRPAASRAASANAA